MRNAWLISIVLLLAACSNSIRKEATGFTQGTTYSVIYYDNGADFQYQIDSLLLSFDRILSTYQESSYISKWNRNEVDGLDQPFMFKEVVQYATEINIQSKEAFDITVSPLMKYWFENDWEVAELDSSTVDSLMELVGMKKIVLNRKNYEKTNPLTKIDVNAIAQGYSVDVVSRFLEGQGIFNYLVEIGGEVRAHGSKPTNQPWIVGIDVPKEGIDEPRELAMSVELNNKSLATSGNYRKFVEINGVKYGHSLNPVTGYPAKTDVLSATVIADDCMTADALATACMVLGFEKAKGLIESNEQIEGILIYSTQTGVETWISSTLTTSNVAQ